MLSYKWAQDTNFSLTIVSEFESKSFSVSQQKEIIL